MWRSCRRTGMVLGLMGTIATDIDTNLNPRCPSQTKRELGTRCAEARRASDRFSVRSKSLVTMVQGEFPV